MLVWNNQGCLWDTWTLSFWESNAGELELWSSDSHTSGRKWVSCTLQQRCSLQRYKHLFQILCACIKKPTFKQWHKVIIILIIFLAVTAFPNNSIISIKQLKYCAIFQWKTCFVPLNIISFYFLLLQRRKTRVIYVSTWVFHTNSPRASELP